jgi:hypothetical protein
MLIDWPLTYYLNSAPTGKVHHTINELFIVLVLVVKPLAHRCVLQKLGLPTVLHD